MWHRIGSSHRLTRALVLTFGLAPSALAAQAPDWDWAQGPSPRAGRSRSEAVARDALGHFTVVGHFSDAASFGSYPLASSGKDDVFIVQYDPQGQVRWASRAGGSGDDGATAVAADAAGNLYVTGHFQGHATFGSTALASAGGDDIFLAKYTAAGTLLWARQAGVSGVAGGTAVAVDSTGNVLVAGVFQGTLNLNATTLTSTAQAGLVAKCAPQGQVLWARSLPDSQVTGVATDGLGSTYVVGTLTAAGGILAKYDATGTLRWVSNGTGTAAGVGYGVTTDQHGDVYVTGSFRSTLAVAPTSSATSHGQHDGFLAKFSPQGTGVWVQGLGGSGDDAGRGVAVSPNGVVGVTGQLQGPAQVGTISAGSASGCGCSVAFVAGYDPQGNVQWVRPATSERTSTGTGLVFDASGGACAVGTFEGPTVFGGLLALRSPLPTSFAARLTAAFPDLVVSTSQAVHGNYHNVNVTATGLAALTGALQITGTLTVQTGGQLDTQCQPITGSGSFVLEGGAELRICHPAGIAATGATGAVQVTGLRQFSAGARYAYAGTAAQQTGTGLPAQVRQLTVDNAAGLTLTQPLRLVQGLRLTNGNLILAGQALALLSDAAGTAQVDNAGGVVQGVVTVQRYIDPSRNAGPGYRHFSSPVQATTVADLTTAAFLPVSNPAYNTSATPQQVRPYPTVFGYDETRLSTAANNLADFDKGYFSPAGNAAPLEVLRGYAVQLAGNQTVDFVGELNNGPYSATLTRGPQADAGWNLIGNPYPSTLDWSRVPVPAGLADAVYVFQSSGPYAGQYRSYVNGIGNPLIALGQGFLVRPSAPNSAVLLALTNAARSADFAAAPVLNRQAADARPLVQLGLASVATGASDETTVYFEAGATGLADPRYDAVKLKGDSTTVSLSSLTSVGEALSINGCPAPASAGTIALRVEVAQPGRYRLAAIRLAHLAGITCFLHDAVTGDSIPLSPTTVYTFQAAKAGTLDNRFSLRFGVAAPMARHHYRKQR